MTDIQVKTEADFTENNFEQDDEDQQDQDQDQQNPQASFNNNDDDDDDDDEDADADGDDDASDSPKYVRLRGLPWSATHQEILDFLKNVNVVNGSKGIHLITSRWDGKNTGEAYVEVQTLLDVEEATKLNKAVMGHRYIEVFTAVAKEAAEALRKTSGHTVSYVVKLRGLPYAVTETQIEEFFNGLEIKADREGILFVMDRRGRSTGEAFVQFESQEDTEQALGRNREKIGHRYIEIFRSSLAELKRASNGGGRPGPYDLKDRGGNRGGSDFGGGNNNNMRGNNMRGGGGNGNDLFSTDWSNIGAGFGVGANNTLGFNNLPGFTNSGNFGNGGGGGGGNFGNGGGGFGGNNGGNFGGNNGGGNFGNGGGGNFGNNGGGGGGGFGNNRFNNGGGNNGGGNFGNDFGDFGNFGNNRNFNNGGGGGGGMNDFGGRGGGNNGGNFGGNNFGNNGGGGNMGGGFNNGNAGGGGNFGPIGGGRGDSEFFTIHMRGLPYGSFENDVFKFYDPIRPANVRINFNKKGLHSGTADAFFETYEDAQLAMKKHREQMGSRYIELFFDGKTKGGNTNNIGSDGGGSNSGSNSGGIGGFSRRI